MIYTVVRQRLTHFSSFKHTRNVSTFGEGLYILILTILCYEPISVSFFQVTPLIISAMFAGDPYSKFENHEKVIRKLVGKRSPSETHTLDETRRSFHSVSGKVIWNESRRVPTSKWIIPDLMKDIDEIDGLGRTALHWASIMGHRNSSSLKNCHYKTQGNYIWDSYESTDKRKPIDLLLELGADPDIKDNYGYTPLRYAVKRDMELGGGFEDIYQFMLSKTELNSTDNSKPKIHMHS